VTLVSKLGSEVISVYISEIEGFWKLTIWDVLCVLVFLHILLSFLESSHEFWVFFVTKLLGFSLVILHLKVIIGGLG